MMDDGSPRLCHKRLHALLVQVMFCSFCTRWENRDSEKVIWVQVDVVTLTRNPQPLCVSVLVACTTPGDY